ncbi:MAG: CocE/NonD family hydrolase, partial [Actinomycetes bacterium]
MGKRWLGIVTATMMIAPFLGWIGLAHASPASAASPGYTATMETFTVHVGPAPGEDCKIVGELFVPDGVTAADPQPAILTTNGFGGSYTD